MICRSISNIALSLSLVIWPAASALAAEPTGNGATTAKNGTASEGSGDSRAELKLDESITAAELLKILIDENIVDGKRIGELIQKVRPKQQDVYGAMVETVSESERDKKPQSDGVVRVPYIPSYVKDEIRDSVRIGLKEDVTRDIMSQARKEAWGVPGANPTWTKKVKFKGDLRLRYQDDRFADDNIQGQVFDVGAINDAGGTLRAGEDATMNITEDRSRARLRFRLGMDAKVTNGIDVKARLVTGKESDPVSTNQTLGQTGEKYTISLDRAYLRWRSYETNWQFLGGRIPNPWFSTDLVWDSDLTFEGLALSYWWLRGDDLEDEYQTWDPYITLGVFPLQEVELSSDDKYMLGAQVGVDYEWWDQSTLRIGLAYYEYHNILGERNPTLESIVQDFTAPEFVQRGNNVFNIRNSADPDADMLALASEFELVNLTIKYGIAKFAPHHVYITADYVKNIGYDEDDVIARVPEFDLSLDENESSEGYKLSVEFGWPRIAKRHDWRIGLAYRYVESDAVLDAFTDSDFLLGGTDAEGFVLSALYGLSDHTWVQLRILSGDSINKEVVLDTTPGSPTNGTFIEGDDPAFGVDVLQLDLNTRF